jgi:hypothetical protein
MGNGNDDYFVHPKRIDEAKRETSQWRQPQLAFDQLAQLRMLAQYADDTLHVIEKLFSQTGRAAS